MKKEAIIPAYVFAFLFLVALVAAFASGCNTFVWQSSDKDAYLGAKTLTYAAYRTGAVELADMQRVEPYLEATYAALGSTDAQLKVTVTAFLNGVIDAEATAADTDILKELLGAVMADVNLKDPTILAGKSPAVAKNILGGVIDGIKYSVWAEGQKQ